jgi:signal transduction histidine kinase/ActR/RegA family two-component response regulator
VAEQQVLLVLDPSMLEEVLRASRVYKGDVPLVVELAQGATATEVARARETHPHDALGVIAATEADALEALAAGADEALAFANVGERELRLVVDRAATRANHRLTHATEQSRAAHSAKLASLGTIVAGVAHEINNPLQALMMNVEMVNRDVSPLLAGFEELEKRLSARRALMPVDIEKIVEQARNGSSLAEMRELLTEMEQQVRGIGELVRDLRIYARTDENEAAEVIEVPDLIDRVVRIVKPQIRLHGHIERDFAPDLPCLVLPRSRVVQVLTNILVNAAQAIVEVKRPVHRVRVTARTDADFVAISVTDTGPGIAPSVLGRIFDPYFTTKGAGKGTGLGLAISQSIARELGGDLLAESVHGEGATFIALFPAATPEAIRTAMRKTTYDKRPLESLQRPTVLVVEDDDRLLRAYPRTLHSHYDVIVASHGQEAIDLLMSGSSADVVLTDLAMPELDGQGLFRWLSENRPELARKTIFVTAGGHDATVSEFLQGMQNIVLEKPVGKEQLLDALHRTLSSRPSGAATA